MRKTQANVIETNNRRVEKSRKKKHYPSLENAVVQQLKHLTPGHEREMQSAIKQQHHGMAFNNSVMLCSLNHTMKVKRGYLMGKTRHLHADA